MMTVAAILKRKGNAVYSALPTDTIADVSRNLSARRIGAVVVMDAGGQLLGILSERDIVQSLATNGTQALQLSAGQLMTRALKTATPETTASEALTLMSAGHFRYLPVIDNGVLTGVVSIGDVVEAKILDQESEAGTLRAYVSGAG